MYIDMKVCIWGDVINLGVCSVYVMSFTMHDMALVKKSPLVVEDWFLPVEIH